MSDLTSSGAIPLLFRKRLPACTTVAAQYVGTDTELDPKDNTDRLIESASRLDPKIESVGCKIET